MAQARSERTQYISQGEATQLEVRLAQPQGNARFVGMAALANAVREGRIWTKLAFPPPGCRALPRAALRAESQCAGDTMALVSFARWWCSG